MALVDIVVINIPITKAQICDFAVIEYLRLARLGQNKEFMGVIAANRAAISAHRDCLQPHTFIAAQVTDQMAVIGVQRILFGQIEIIPVLHQEFAAPHDTETRADFIAEFPLDMIESQRQILVTADMGAEDISDQFLIGRAIEHIAAMAVCDAQHFLAVIIIASALAPKIGRLQGRHQHRNMACPHLLFMHDRLDPLENLITQRKPAIDPRAGLFDHACAQHQAVACNLRLGGRFFQDRQEIAGQAHSDPHGLW